MLRQQIAGLEIVFRNTFELHEKVRKALNETHIECEETGKKYKALWKREKTLKNFLGVQPVDLEKISSPLGSNS